MDDWKGRWQRVGGAVMGATLTVFVAVLVASQPSHVAIGRRVIPVAAPDFVPLYLVLAGAFLLGLYCYIASSLNNPLWLPGRRGAKSPDCTIEAILEYDPDSEESRWGIKFAKQTIFFVVVHNKGGTATFSAQFSNIHNLIRRDGYPTDSYFGKVAWEDVTEDRQTLGADSRANLLALCLFRDPVVAWFQIPYSAKWAAPGVEGVKQLAGWALRPVTPGQSIEFDLKVVNETKKVSKMWHVVVPWSNDGVVSQPSVVALT